MIEGGIHTLAAAVGGVLVDAGGAIGVGASEPEAELEADPEPEAAGDGVGVKPHGFATPVTPVL